jgi:tRNA dimethylallyltransferase
MIKKKAVVVLGPTSSGKTALAVKLAYQFAGEIISADSRQVYIGMDIGTGKDLTEYKFKDAKGKAVKINYHLIDVIDPKKIFSLSNYLVQANQALLNISGRDKLPLIVGGTGLYLQALVDNFQFLRWDFPI